MTYSTNVQTNVYLVQQQHWVNYNSRRQYIRNHTLSTLLLFTTRVSLGRTLNDYLLMSPGTEGTGKHDQLQFPDLLN